MGSQQPVSVDTPGAASARGLKSRLHLKLNPRADEAPPALHQHWRGRKRGSSVFTHLSDLSKGLIFYGIVIVLAIAFTFVPLDGDSVARYSMFIPLFVVLVMLLVVTRDGHSRNGWASLGLHHAGFRGWPVAIL